MWDTVFLILSIAGISAECLLASLTPIHMLQLESYQAPGYLRWLSERGVKGYWIQAAAAAVYLAAVIARAMGSAMAAVILTVLSLLVGALYIWKSKIRDAKKPLRYTARIKRFIAAELFLLVIAAILAVFTGTAAYVHLMAALPLFVLFVHYMMLPVETAVNNWYKRDAEKMLRARTDLLVIGITGSYGKTSVKYILGTILKEKFSVLVPPSSYNTPMGLTRVIREQLESGHQIFLAEMGARHVGDIKELVEMVRPKIGIITSVGPQHLETFFTVENVQNTKYELIEGLPDDGAAFFPDDSGTLGLARPLYDRSIKAKKFLFGESEDCDVRVYDIKTGSSGSEFTVKIRDAEPFRAVTKLLGTHNIMNIAAGISVAHYLGMSEEEIKRGVSLIEPVEHRLQLIPTGNGVNVIDDAFNSNPQGAAAAVEVLSSFEGRKIIVTPGMVEFGEKQDEVNADFARKIADKCDIVFLIGKKQTASMYRALAEESFNMENVHVCGSLNEASGMMGPMLSAGDTVLFENDLPDNYTE